MLTVSSVRAADRREALSLLFDHLPAAEKTEQIQFAESLADEGQLIWDGLLAARDDDGLQGACLTVAQADGSLGVWIPVVAHPARTVPSHVQAVAAALLSEVARRQDEQRLAFAQCLLDETPCPAERWLTDAGFERMAELSFLHRDLTQPLPMLPEHTYETESFRAGVNEQRFAAMVEASYRESLDCPKFTGLRTGVEALDSHRTTGVFHPDMWRLFRSAGSDVGVLLCADHPELESWELAYMGVSPAARGGGLGRLMVICAMHAAREAGRQRMQLAVDSANRYAIDAYKKSGFEEQCRRVVFLRRCGGSSRHVIHDS